MAQRWATWYRGKSPILRFVVLLLVLLGLFELAVATEVATERVIPGYLRFCAGLSGVVMGLGGEEVTVVDSTVSSPRYSVNIKRGCDAVQPSLLFVAAVLASPVAFWSKLPGVVLGLLFLMVMNLVRVISLFYVGVHFPTVFDTMHEDVWQAAFIILAILVWGVWALWAARKTIATTHAVS